jgi:dihydroorotate dehydrogenase (fumarate)
MSMPPLTVHTCPVMSEETSAARKYTTRATFSDRPARPAGICAVIRRGRDVEQRHLDIPSRVKDTVTVPVAVKLSPYFSSTAEIASRLDEAGADGLVLFNRFLQPDIDPETLTEVPTVTLSTADESRLPRTWIALLRGRVRASLAATTGVESATDLIKYLLAGADVVMSASALLRHDPEHAGVLLDGLCEWMGRKGFTSVDDVRGMLTVPSGADETARQRADYVSALRQANTTTYGPS